MQFTRVARVLIGNIDNPFAVRTNVEAVNISATAQAAVQSGGNAAHCRHAEEFIFLDLSLVDMIDHPAAVGGDGKVDNKLAAKDVGA